MSEPVHLINKFIVGGDSGVSGDMSSTITSLAINVDEGCSFNVQARFTGTPTGTIKLQGSDDPVALGYTDITSSISSVTVAGSYMVNYDFPNFSFLQLVYTPAGGSGTLVAKINAKRR